MSVETKQKPSAIAVSQLQELIQINIDSRDGFRQAAQAIDDLTLQSAFELLADNRQDQSDELARFVPWSGKLPRRAGSYSAAMYQSWMSIREMLSSDDRYAILCEAERGEDSIKAAYEDVLRCTAGCVVHDVLVSHYDAINSAHDRIRDLRDECKCG